MVYTVSLEYPSSDFTSHVFEKLEDAEACIAVALSELAILTSLATPEITG